MTDICSIALENLKENIIQHEGKLYIVAGAIQFHTIWIRDFGYCVDILHKLGLDKIIDNTIELYLNHLIKDSKGHLYGPKCFDSMNPETRVVNASARHTFNMHRKKTPINKLDPHMYKDSRNAIAIDSNVMICLAALNTNIYKKHINTLKELLNWYSTKDADGLIIQTGFSDFQDSQRREGVVFNINLMYYVCIKKYKQKGYDLGINLKELKKKIISVFYDPIKGIFISQKNEKYICLLDNLLAIKYKFIPVKKLYLSLKNSELWSASKLKIPGFPTWPHNKDVHIQVKFGYLTDYHNDIYWGWLMAFSAAISFEMDDKKEGHKIYNILEHIAIRDGTLSEIYKPEPNFPIFESSTYSSERPFTMSSCYALKMCNEYS